LFVRFSLSVPWEPLVVVPLGPDANKEELAKLLGMMPGFRVESRDNYLLAGSARALKGVGGPSAAPAALGKAFAAAGDRAIQVIALAPPYLRRAVVEAVPKLPVGAGGAALKDVDRAFVWAAAGFDVAPKLSARVVIQAGGAEDAKLLKEIVDKSLEFAGN